MSVFFAEFVINPNGKSEVCILHEYMQRVLKVRPVYNFFECGKSVFLNSSILVLMLNQESRNVVYTKNITGIRLILGFFS